jgi:uncharacterized membrane protein
MHDHNYIIFISASIGHFECSLFRVKTLHLTAIQVLRPMFGIGSVLCQMLRCILMYFVVASLIKVLEYSGHFGA